ncbi:hypothetical protein [uncultured Ferrimonas sp.]|uniref:AcrVA2 family anti-CRISPR protein n=1 Tax=uncultured Ferrimonas sp. TaxID=432640 RepID=UPI002632B1C0|nr:hypothetical protein [uncultured Ferrimonas sp.]
MPKKKRKKLNNSQKRAQAKKHSYQSPRSELNRLTRKFPAIWSIIEAEGLIHCDASCLVSSGTVDGIIRSLIDFDQIQPEPHLAEQYTALAAWRYTQGVYDFAPTLVQELIETPITGDIPTQVIERLPEWCVYIPVNNEKLNKLTGKQLKGFFAHIDHRSDFGVKLLTLLLDFGSELVPYHVMLGDWDLHTGIAKAYEHLSGRNHQLADVTNIELGEVIPELVSALMSLTLYLCTEKPDIERFEPEATSQHRHHKLRTGMKLQPPSRPKVWPVGKTIAKQLKQVFSPRNCSKTGKSKKPHIRRAHWHGVWRGKRGTAERRFVLVWWGPTVINANI